MLPQRGRDERHRLAGAGDSKLPSHRCGANLEREPSEGRRCSQGGELGADTMPKATAQRPLAPTSPSAPLLDPTHAWLLQGADWNSSLAGLPGGVVLLQRLRSQSRNVEIHLNLGS